MLTPQGLAEFQEVRKRYPAKRAAILPLFHLFQKEQGFVSAEAEEWIARELDLAPVQVHEVLTFYTMLHQEPAGKYHLQVCRTLPCWLGGAGRLLRHLGQKYGIRTGEKTRDGRLGLQEVECLGACGNAPVVQVNDDYHWDLTVEKLDRLLESLR